MRILFFVISLLWGVQIAAAEELIEFLTESADLTPQQLSQVRSIEQLPTTANVEVVKFNAEALQADAMADVSISLDTATTLNFPVANQRRTSEIEEEENFLWSAFADFGLENEGVQAATVAVTNGEVSATIRTEGQVFRVQPLPGGLSALIEVNTDAFPLEHPEMENEVPEGAGETGDINPSDFRDEADQSVAEIAVLVLATPAAAEGIGGLQAFVDLAVAVSNESFENSGVAARLRLVGYGTVDGYAEAGSHKLDLNALWRKSDGLMDEAHGYRDETSADIVVLLTADSSYCGLAKAIYASAETAFATVYWPCAVDNLSFPHEIGHLLGACHNPERSSGCSPFSYGHGFIIPSRRIRTIMAYNCPDVDCVRMPQWARPEEWGTSSRSHDARVLNQTTPRAALFRND